MEFEWDDAKAAANLRDHGVSFAKAAAACGDPFAVEWIDYRHPPKLRVYHATEALNLGGFAVHRKEASRKRS